MILSDEQIHELARRIKDIMRFKEVQFFKQINSDIYFMGLSSDNEEFRIRYKPSMKTVFHYKKGSWEQIKGLRIELE